MKRFFAAAGLPGLLLLAGALSVPAGGTEAGAPPLKTTVSAGPFVDRVRTVAARLGDVHAALAEGYTALPCASGMESGSMGIHYVNPAYLADDALDLSRPEAVMYEPQPDGSLQLVGAEYITFKGPANLGGHLFNFVTAPNRYGLDPYYELHVWAWRPNPRGPFADMNPDVSCIWAGPGGYTDRPPAKSRMGVP
jgi:hypothetical protein